MKTFSIILISIIICRSLCFGQTNPLPEYYLPNTFSKPMNWVNAEKMRHEDVKIDTGHNQEISINQIPHHRISRELTFSNKLGFIKGQSDLYSFLEAKRQAILQYEKYFPYLISFLTDTTNVGLSNIDYPMIFTKDSPFLADTLIIKENLTSVAGRASCILNELTGETFAVVRPETTIPELNQYQLLWIVWIQKLDR